MPRSTLLLTVLALFWALLGSRSWVYAPAEYALWVDQAEGIRWNDLRSLYHPIEPFGYPLLLRCAFAVTRDYRLAGTGVSLASGILCLYALGRLFRRFDVGPWVRLAALALIGLERFFVFGATTPGNDMIHLLLLTLACLLFCKEERTGRDAFMTGLIVGIGFLNRYAMVWFLAGALLCLAPERRRAIRSKQAGFLLLGFLLPAVLQFGLNGWVTGSPAGGKLAQIAYFIRSSDGDYGDLRNAWLRGAAGGEGSIGHGVFLGLLTNIREWFEAAGHLFHVWLFLFLPGLLSALQSRSGMTPLRAYVLVNTALLVDLCLVPPAPALALFALPPLVLFGTVFLAQDFFGRLRGRPTVTRATAAATVLAAAASLAWWDLRTFTRPSAESARNLAVEQLLEELNADREGNLVELGTGFRRVTDPRPLPYPTIRSSGNGADLTVESLKRLLRERDARYLLFGEPHGLRRFPRLWILLGPLTGDTELELVELWRGYPSVALYRFRPAEPSSQKGTGQVRGPAESAASAPEFDPSAPVGTAESTPPGSGDCEA